jgi:hypothetical protein
VVAKGLLYFVLLCYMRNIMHSPTIKTNLSIVFEDIFHKQKNQLNKLGNKLAVFCLIRSKPAKLNKRNVLDVKCVSFPSNAFIPKHSRSDKYLPNYVQIKFEMSSEKCLYLPLKLLFVLSDFEHKLRGWRFFFKLAVRSNNIVNTECYYNKYW